MVFMTQKPKSKRPFVLIFMAVLIGSALLRLINFQDFSVRKPALAAVYLVTLVMMVIFWRRGSKSSGNH
jgi:hypothetical protein